MKSRTKYGLILGLATMVMICGLALAASAKGKPPRVEVYVTSQGLLYESIVSTQTLPNQGPFQQLVPGGPFGLETEFGPGDPGYLGGRWWVDVDESGTMNEGDSFFLCPLLPPGVPVD